MKVWLGHSSTLTCRYLKQKQRWQDYVKLFSFLAFVALFLAVLFLQRNAQVAYQVGAVMAFLQHGQQSLGCPVLKQP